MATRLDETDPVRALHEARQREAAMRDVLSVLNRSRSDEKAVFDVILDSALKLCDAELGTLFLNEEGDTHQKIVAQRGGRSKWVEMFETDPPPLDPAQSATARALIEKIVVQIDDLADTDLYRQGQRHRVAGVDDEGCRSILLVPLIGENIHAGAISIYRREVRPFTARDVDLVRAFAEYAVTAIENARQFRAIEAASAELERRLEREQATGQVLEVISQSRDDEKPVFDVILENAARLCHSPIATLVLVDEARQNWVVTAHWGDPVDSTWIGRPVPFDAPLATSRAMIEKRCIQITDVADEDAYRKGQPDRVRLVNEEGVRTLVCVPLVQGDLAIGCIVLYRREVRPYPDDEIALVETFAAQAVIAIENVRQFRKLQTRLQREAASREILGVISQSRDDEKPVFDVILENASRLCNAQLAFAVMANDERTHLDLKSHRGDSFSGFVEYLRQTPMPLDANEAETSRAVLECRTIQIEDLRSGELYDRGQPHRMLAVEDGGIRTLLIVPLVARGIGIGALNLWRVEVSPFSDDEVALVEAFAAQAVIAIENVRQFRELQTRLEREAASREILSVISQSRDDEKPVFQVIHESASRLCDAPFSGIYLISADGDHLDFVSHVGGNHVDIEAYRTTWPLTDVSAVVRAAVKRKVVHIEDLRDTDAYRAGHPETVKVVDEEGARTFLAVPLIKSGAAIGSIGLYRREARPFSADQIALVEAFAAQSVIAIENVRQFRAIQAANSELQTRLEREAATSEILDVISRSRDLEKPVFDIILENAARLCGTPLAGMHLLNDERTELRLAANRGLKSETLLAYDMTWPIDGESLVARTVRTMAPVHIEDLSDKDAYRVSGPGRVAMVDVEGFRSCLVVPMISGRTAIGALWVFRRIVQPFTDDEITLLQTFAAQAVIAIENVRQFRELDQSNHNLTQALERQTATADVLDVISQSRSELQPVLDKIAATAAQLCRANNAGVWRKDGDLYRIAAHTTDDPGLTDHFRQNPMIPPPGGPFATAIAEHRPIHLEDVHAHPVFRDNINMSRSGARTWLGVPMILPNGEPTGVIVLTRSEQKPFDASEINLVRTFADQASIAIENVRLFTELQTRLQHEEASREILGVISGSREEEMPVFDMILAKAADLCNAPLAFLAMADDERKILEIKGHKGDSFPEFVEFLRENPLPLDAGKTDTARAVLEVRTVQIEDLRKGDLFTRGQPHRLKSVQDADMRTLLVVPLIRGGVGIGSLNLWRTEVSPFSADEIELVESFAAQAVIAIDNVRQFRELQTRLEREEATSEILGVISQSRDDSLPVFDVILENAVRLCQANNALLLLADEERGWFDVAAEHGARSVTVEELRRNPHPLDRDVSEISLAYMRNEIRQVENLADTEGYRKGEHYRRLAVDQEGVRSLLTVPLVLGAKPIGVFMLYRREPGRFADGQVDIVKTFAAQAAIAIQNVRQFRELQIRLEREAATRETLEVISRSREHEKPVFDMILKNAVRLCRAPLASLNLLDDAGERLILQARWGDELEEVDAGATEFPLDGGSAPATAVRESRLVRIEDMADTETYRSGDPIRVRAVDVHGIRSFLAVPLMRDGKAIGCIDLFRREVSPFEDRHVDLVETFAAQAVIAIENVRQLRALVEARDDAEAALADLKKAQERLIQAEKMASLGQLTAGIAHEIKNPLNFVNNFARLSGDMVTELAEILEGPIASLDEEDREDAEDLMQTVRDNLDKINQHGRRADNIVKNMLLHSREGPSQRGTARINNVAAEALNLAYHGARAENSSFNIDMKTDLDEEVGHIECYPQDLMRVFLNIISNGMYAAHKRSLDEEGVAPTITVSSRRDGDRVVVEVRDNGPGIPTEVRERIFTPFFTTKPAGEGTGLGLSLSYDIVVKQHGGDLTVESKPGQFTAFTVTLPQTLPAETGGNR